MRSLLIFLVLCVSCKKEQPVDQTKFGDPVGIELQGEGLMGAVAAEAGHEIPASAVPELATALVAATKACPDLKATVVSGKYVSVRATVKDGTIQSPPDGNREPLDACVAKAMDGKPVKTLPSTKILVQIASKEPPK
jgi:hypothetical protein